MFSFMKKNTSGNSVPGTGAVSSMERDEKERKRKEKKERKEKDKREKGIMSTEDLLRLDEVRRSLKLRGRRKEKEKLPSGITADYSANFFGNLDRDTLTESSNSSLNIVQTDNNGDTVPLYANTSVQIIQQRALPLPPLPPRPPKRGILKQNQRHSIASFDTEGYDSSLLIRNTMQNELITYQHALAGIGSWNKDVVDHCVTNANDTNSLESVDFNGITPIVYITNHDKENCESPSIESLTDSTTNSSFATPPFSSSPVGEGQGFYSRFSNVLVSSSPDEMITEFPLPDIEPILLPEPRELNITRRSNPRNDFGFSLRRIMTVERPGGSICQFKSVILAECGADEEMQEIGLLPGDRLLEVNGVPVEDKTREEIIEMIKSSDTSVSIKVQPIPELSELSRRYHVDGTSVQLDDCNIKCGTLRRSGSKRFKHSDGKSDEQLQNEKRWLDCERCWLIHKMGFTAVRVLTRSHDTGKVGICLEFTGEQASVDEDDIEIANPLEFDHCEDLAHLRYVNESSVLHTLRCRYGSNLIHTYAGPTMIIINPMAPLSIYSDKVAHMFRGCKAEDMPAHIFAIAQSAYREALSTRRDQSVVLLGRSGSGKTFNYKYILQYFAITTAPSNKILNYEKLNAIWMILESFGNAKTALNNNATRFTHLFSLDFDHMGQIASASIQVFSYEKWRIIRRLEGEYTFHIMYRLLAGVDGILRKELLLDQISSSDQNIFFTPLTKHDEKQKALMDFSRLCSSFKVLGFSDEEVKVIYLILAAIIHLGYAGTSAVGGSNRWQFGEPAAAQRAAKCLSITVEDLSRIIFAQAALTPTGSNKNYRNSSSSPTDSNNKILIGDDITGADALEGFIVGLYTEVFNLVASLVNRCLMVSTNTVNSILVLDCPGFQNPASCGHHQDGATFNDLCHNYLHERLQLLFHYTNLDIPRDKYNQEHIDVVCDKEYDASPETVVNLLDTSSSNFLRSSQLDLRQLGTTDKRAPGLLWLLDDISSSFQNTNDHTFLEKIFSLYSEREDHLLIRKAPGNNHFIVQHCQGTNPVLYRADGWIKLCRENPYLRSSIIVLQESENKEISSLFANSRGAGLNSSITSLDGTHSLRRVSSIRRTFTTGYKRKSVSLQVKFNVDGLIETLRRTKVKFVHCFLPHHDSGLIDKCGTGSFFPSSTCNNTLINVPLLRSQLRGSEILPVVRIYKQGFPKSMLLNEFCRRFNLLVKNTSAEDDNSSVSSIANSSNDHTIVQNILQEADIDASSYRIGISQIFFRSNVLSQLEGQRDEKLTDLVIRLQSHCRGHLSRKRLAKLKVEDLAVRCIQRNVRNFMLVRDWPWWRLLARVTPLLNVHRTEQELKIKTDELEVLKLQFQKIELEKNLLKQENSRLDSKLSEMTADLSEEQSAATVTGERLELETAERVRLENELQHVQNKNKKLQESSERLEMELLCMKTADANGIGGNMDEDEGTLGSEKDGVYKKRYERVARELEFTKRRLQQQHHDDLEQLIGLRKQLEKKLSDAYEEVDEQRQVVAQWKRKVQKLNGEMNDIRMLLEESNSRNNLLEKKQRKFDSELQLLHDELRQEKQARERFNREKDMALTEKYSLEQNLSAVKLELELKEQKVSNLMQELQEVSYGGGTEEEVAKLRKTKHELENKVAEQEEELDDLAGQVQILEQAKLRSEMNLEHLRKEHKKELAQRDEESDDIRCSTTKKVKALECQLENEHEERTLLLRERHELERRLAESEERDRSSRSADQESIGRLKRDLKKTRVLLHDAQLMLQQAKTDAPNKAILRQLRNQLEDAECARNTALKTRQLLESEISELSTNLEEAQRARCDAEDRAAALGRERTQLQSQLDENEEELAEVLKKYRSTVQQLSNEQLTLHEQANRIAELESERASLKEQVAEITSRLESIETHGDPTSSLTVKRLELKTKELESKLELEQTTRSRMEVQIGRLKEAAEKLQHDADVARTKESSAQETVRRLQRTLREAREVQAGYESKETTEAARRSELEKKVEQLEMELASTKADLKLALHRVDDLQSAIQGDLEDIDDGDQSDSDNDSANSDTSLQSYLTHSNPRVSVHRWFNSDSNNRKLDDTTK